MATSPPAAAPAPTVSVLMAAYNGAALLPETIGSLLAQTFADWELVVVDDGSTDGTADLLAAVPDLRIRLIRAPENGGVVRARNLAAAHARGRYWAALDQDDLCQPGRFAAQVAYLDGHPDTVLLGTAAAVLTDGRVRASSLPPTTTPDFVEYLLHLRNPLVWSSVMIRADAGRRLDPFIRADYRYADDYDLHHRLMALGRVARLDEELTIYRYHLAQASQRHVDTMVGNAVKVATEAYRPIFGPEAPERALLVARHVMNGDVVPDRTTLQRLGETIMAVQGHFLRTRRPDQESQKLIRWETARLWGRIGRQGQRSGALALTDRFAVRPDHLGMGYANAHDLMLSGLVGGARALRRKAIG